MKEPINIFWYRRDLRLDDNAGLYHALKSNHSVLPIFIFDYNILKRLDDKHDARVSFIHQSIQKLHEELRALGSTINVYYGKPVDVWKEIISAYNIEKVFTNSDYGLYARQRDPDIAALLKERGIAFHEFKDQVIFEKDEVLKDDGKPYTVFTPYSRKWKTKLNTFYLKPYPTEKYFNNFYKTEASKLPLLESIGFKPTNISIPSSNVSDELIKKYHEQRNFPAVAGTSKLGVHLRFGTISIRKLAQRALALNETYLNELIWRDFYHMILWHFPHAAKNAFKKEYDNIVWRNNEEEFKKWCEGKTGYPIVDAGMRELNATGYMHNRVRMITASFLTKHLLIDWRWGEAYFAKKLLDFDLAANNGGWQWAASTGCDAAPYFRIFNPTEQTKKFDPELKYIKQWVPELNSFDYPKPIVEHTFARNRALETYKQALSK
jgi:deoxyribodipyrimidine photo-lyase